MVIQRSNKGKNCYFNGLEATILTNFYSSALHFPIKNQTVNLKISFPSGKLLLTKKDLVTKDIFLLFTQVLIHLASSQFLFIPADKKHAGSNTKVYITTDLSNLSTQFT